MENPNPFPITEENFPQCWDYVDKRRRTARKKARIFKTGSFLSGLTFLLLVIYSGHGLLYTYLNGKYCEFLAWVPYFSDSWQIVSSTLLNPEAPWYINLLPLLLASYSAADLVFLAVALVLLLLYHPLKKKLPQEGTQQEKAKQMTLQASKAYWSARQIKAHTSTVCIVLLYVSLAWIFMLFTFYMEDAFEVRSMLSVSWSNSAELNLNLIIIGICAVYAPFDYLRSLIVYLPLRYSIPYSFVVDVERYYVLSNCKESQSPEQLREQALELEGHSAYAKAKELLLQAACLGDVPAMEHYARHCLIAKQEPAARYWLEACTASGQASPEAEKMLKRMKWHLKHKARYLNA